jgi:general secretion pathway protein N
LEYIWPKAQPYVGRLPVKIELVTGTIWQGQVRVNIPQTGKFTGQWDIQVAELLSGNLAAQFVVNGDELKLEGFLRGSADQVAIVDSEAFISSRYLEPLLRQGRSSLTGDFELNAFNALLDIANKKIVAADGRLLFSGGDVSFPLDGKNMNATLPILIGKIQKPEDNVELLITNTDGQDIGNGYVQPDGWAGIGIRRRFLDILGLKWPAEDDAEKVIFEASQKLL